MHENNWIPASIPPAQDGLYLTTVKTPLFNMLWMCEFKYGVWMVEGIDMTILAWQPLPALYKAGD